MGYSNGNITAPINSDDVTAVTRYTNHDWGHFCSASNPRVNKWSKHKPVRGESPQDYTTWNENTGNVRGVVGYPIVWGMMLPFNTKEQLAMTNTSISQWLRPLAVRAAHVLNDQAKCANIKNYVYCPPVVNVDFSRIGDYVGYNHRAPEGWTCGVRGATAIASVSDWNGSPGMLLNVDSFDTNEIEFYIGMPSNADISFKDLYTGDYRFIVELYNSDPTTFQADGTDPIAVLVCMTKIADMTWGGDFAVTVQWLKTKFTSVTNGETTLRAILGVVRFGNTPTLTEMKRANNSGLGCALLSTSDYSKIVTGSGSIPPWTSSYKPYLCQITMRSFSKLFVSALQYAHPTSGSYQNFPSTAINLGADGFRVKTSIQNQSTSAVTLNHPNSGPKFQFQAHGAYDTSDPSYSAMCESPADGKWHDVTISSASDFSNANQITIAAGATNNAVYMRCLGFLPIGRTSSVTIRVSTDGGANWYITGSFSASFIVT